MNEVPVPPAVVADHEGHRLMVRVVEQSWYRAEYTINNHLQGTLTILKGHHLEVSDGTEVALWCENCNRPLLEAPPGDYLEHVWE